MMEISNSVLMLVFFVAEAILLFVWQLQNQLIVSARFSHSLGIPEGSSYRGVCLCHPVHDIDI